MLLEKTYPILWKVSEECWEYYSEGGMTFVYTHAKGRVHLKRHEKKLGHEHSERKLNRDEITKLKLFFEKVFFTPYPEGISEKTEVFLSGFLSALDKDAPNAYWELMDYEDYEYGVDLSLLMIESRDYHQLDLSWSYD